MNDSPQDMWNQRYQQDGFLFGRDPNAFVKSQAHLFKPGKEVLSIADGEGRNGVFVARQGAQVTSVDFSAPALNKARGLAEEYGVELTIEQQDIFHIALQHTGLNGRTHSDNLVRINAAVRFLAEELLHRFTDLRHAGHAAH